MKNILLLFILFTSLVSWGQRVNIDELTVSNNTYSFNGNLYNGSVYVLYDSGQLKEEFGVQKGILDGEYTLFQLDKYFKKINFKDTLEIHSLLSHIDTTQIFISKQKKDSIRENRISYDIKFVELGVKKFYKYQERYREGKLKKEKLYIYQRYLQSIKKLENSIQRLKESYTILDSLELKLMEEKDKSIYRNQLKEKYTYVKGNQTGIHMIYDDYESLELEEELKDGIRNGSFKIYENGKVKEEGTYHNNKKDGLWTFHSYNGKEEVTFSNDLKDGPFKKIKGDIIVEQGTYSNDLMTGEWIFRWDNGNLKGQGNYNDGDGVLSDFQKTTECKYPFPYNGKEGLWLTFYESGVVKDSSNYSNGKRDGIAKMFHENGQLWSYTNYIVVDGISEVDDHYVEYDENGNKIFENVEIEDNKRKSTRFYTNGNKKEEYYVVNGKLNGEDKRYYESGEIQFRLFHKEGKRDRTKKTTCYYKNGNIWYEGIAGEGETEWYGEYKKYHENGNVMEISNYDMSGNGRILSTKKYDINGKEIIQKSTIEFWNTEENKEVLLNHIIEDIDWHSPRSVEPVKYCFVKEKDFMGRYSRGYEITFLIIIDAQNAFGTYKRSSNWFSIYKNGDGTYKFSGVTHNEDERGYRGIITFPDEREIKNKLREF